MKLVISLGGSLLAPPDQKISADNFEKYAAVLRKLWRAGHKIIVVCGGGKTAREYQAAAKKLGVRGLALDYIGTAATWQNSMTLGAILGRDSFPHWLPYSQAKKAFGKKILVYGGEKPGHSTDWDAVWFAKQVRADMIINATNVAGVYTKDPHKFKDAKRVAKMTYEEYLERFGRAWRPGMHVPFDFEAVKLLLKSRPRIKTIVIDGRDAENILKAARGKVVGTALI